MTRKIDLQGRVAVQGTAGTATARKQEYRKVD